MDEKNLNAAEDSSPETPEDVAVLYTWANVHGGKYRDFSASRREFRAQQRHRQVEAQRQAELDAARQKEEAAARELEEARRAEEEATHDAALKAEAEEARRRAEERAEQERLAAQRHVETAEELKRAMEQAQQEMEDARHRAEEQAARYAEADARLRRMQAEHPEEFIPGLVDDPYYFAGPLEPTAYAPGKGVRSSVPARVSSESRITASYYRAREENRDSGEYRAVPRRFDSSYSFERRSGESSVGRYNGPERRVANAYSLGSPIAPEVVERAAERLGYRPEYIAPRPDTPEDVRERARNDERYRRENIQGSEERYDDLQNDGYYDRMPMPLTSAGPQRHSAERGSAQSDLHILPRTQRVRALSDTGVREPDEPVIEDPEPGGVHRTVAIEEVPRRRRESATDFSARTERRPRHVEPNRVVHEGPQAALPPAAAPPRPATPAQPREGRPEWLLRNRAAEEAGREQLRNEARELARETQRRIEERERAGEEDNIITRRSTDNDARSEVIPPVRPTHEEERALENPRPKRDEQVLRGTDGGFNLKPMLDRPPMNNLPPLQPQSATRDLPPMSDRPRVREQKIEAPPPVAEVRQPAVDAVRRAQAERRSAPRSSDTFITRRTESSTDVHITPQPERFAHREETRRADDHVAPPQPPSAPRSVLAENRRAERHNSSGADRTAEMPAYREQPKAEIKTERKAAPVPPASASQVDTLQQSRERVAARWFALKGLMNNGTDTVPEPSAPPARGKEVATPTLAVVSMSGGVGKTSLVATLGRALSARGEKVLLADTTAHGLLPYYFGARELRPDVVRTFSPPPGSSDAPVYMVNYETDRLNGDDTGQATLVEEIGRHARGTQRILLDLNGSSAWLARRMAEHNGAILVPIAPDMNSVLSIQNVDRFFSGAVDHNGRPVQPYYVLAQFDASLPLHLDVREVLRQQLGDRLLPVMIRRSPSVSEALAEGMTVIDYAPESPVTEDYQHLADWVRNLAAAPATTGVRNIRWSER